MNLRKLNEQLSYNSVWHSLARLELAMFVDMTPQQLETQNSATVSRVIKDAVSSGLVKPYDPEAGAKAMRYVPHWS
ncbi:hypothetical protein AB6E76_007160 [Vibrio cyclitrophicus]